jgi:hypothetical protein
MGVYVVKDFVKIIAEFQKQSLVQLIEQIIAALKTQHYSFPEILDALAQYTKSRQDWKEVTEHLLGAKAAVLQASAKLRGVEEEEEDDDDEIG